MHPQRRKTSEVLFSKFSEENKRSFIQQPSQELKDDSRVHFDMANRLTHNVTKNWPTHHLSRLYYTISLYPLLFFILEIAPLLQFKSAYYLLVFGFFHVIGKQFWLLTTKFELACLYLLGIGYFQYWILISLFNEQGIIYIISFARQQIAFYYSVYLAVSYYWDYYNYDRCTIARTIKLMNLKVFLRLFFQYSNLEQEIEYIFVLPKKTIQIQMSSQKCDNQFNFGFYLLNGGLGSRSITILWRPTFYDVASIHGLEEFKQIRNQTPSRIVLQGISFVSLFTSKQWKSKAIRNRGFEIHLLQQLLDELNSISRKDRSQTQNTLQDFLYAYFDTKIIEYSQDLGKILNKHERVLRNQRFLWQRSILADVSLISQRITSYQDLMRIEKDIGVMIQFYLIFIDVYDKVCKERDIRDMQAIKKINETMKGFEELEVVRIKGMKKNCRRQVNRFKQMIQFSQMNKY